MGLNDAVIKNEISNNEIEAFKNKLNGAKSLIDSLNNQLEVLANKNYVLKRELEGKELFIETVQKSNA